MTIHVDTQTGAPIFVLNQMMMLSSIRDVYKKYGIHGIYYAVLFGWSGSPFASLTNDSIRDENVVKEVYGSKYYDPVQKEEIASEPFSCKEQYKQQDMKAAIKMITSLARVPIIEERNLFLKLLDRNQEDLKKEAEPTDFKGMEMIASAQKPLLLNRTALNKNLEAILIKEKEILLRSDPKASLSDFINKISPENLAEDDG